MVRNLARNLGNLVPHLGRARRWALLSVAAASGLALAPVAASHAATAGAGVRAAMPGAALPVLTFKTTGKKVTIGGTLESGAERVAFSVSGESSASPVLVRLDPGVSPATFFAHFQQIGADQNNITGIGEIVLTPGVNAGNSSGVFVDLLPGTYIALDLGMSNGPSGPPPPTTVFTVTKSAHPAALPRPGATIASREFGFVGAVKLHRGELVRWQNRGYLVHMIVGAEASSLANANKLAADLKAGNDNAAQKLAINFANWDNVLTHGQSFESVVNQPAGFWVIICFMDTQDGREHTVLGMEKVIQIVK
jgi:hypothetical protein